MSLGATYWCKMQTESKNPPPLYQRCWTKHQHF